MQIRYIIRITNQPCCADRRACPAIARLARQPGECGANRRIDGFCDSVPSRVQVSEIALYKMMIKEMIATDDRESPCVRTVDSQAAR
jgi:hypothetical protein